MTNENKETLRILIEDYVVGRLEKEGVRDRFYTLITFIDNVTEKNADNTEG